jgi:hypothetical protein
MVMRCYPFPRGQGRLIGRTPLHGLRFDGQSLLVRTVDGFSMNVVPNGHIGRHLYLTGQFDRTIRKTLTCYPLVPVERVEAEGRHAHENAAVPREGEDGA